MMTAGTLKVADDEMASWLEERFCEPVETLVAFSKDGLGLGASHVRAPAYQRSAWIATPVPTVTLYQRYLWYRWYQGWN